VVFAQLRARVAPNIQAPYYYRTPSDVSLWSVGICYIDRRYSSSRNLGAKLSCVFVAMDLGNYLHCPRKPSRTTVPEDYRWWYLCDVDPNDCIFCLAQVRHRWRWPLSRTSLTLAYSAFALSEWTVVFLIAGFDAVSIFDFGDYKLQIIKRRVVGTEESGISCWMGMLIPF